VNKAARHKLLRVPGLSVRNVDRILRMRRVYRIRIHDLSKLRVSLKKVRPWAIAADHNPDALRIDRDDLRLRITHASPQLELFDARATAGSGEI
jgi:predicted DNA-binding helix-hairpin-helix protein